MCVFVFPASDKLEATYAFLCAFTFTAIYLVQTMGNASPQSLSGLLTAHCGRQIKLVYVIMLFVMHYEILLGLH